MAHILKLKQTIGGSYSVDPDDVINTKRALTSLGFYKVPDYGITPYPDDQMFEGIKGFQRANGLEVDGIINPEGETETAMSRRPKKPTENECRTARRELQRMEAELQQLELEWARANAAKDQKEINRLKPRRDALRWGIRGAKNTLEYCNKV